MTTVEDTIKWIANLERRLAIVETLEIGVFVPLAAPLTSTSYDGNDTVNLSTTTTIDTSAVFGAPIGIRAALVRIGAQWTAAGTTRSLQCRPTGSGVPYIIIRSQAANIYNDAQGIVACDANGDYDLVCGAGENAVNVVMIICGYWL